MEVLADMRNCDHCIHRKVCLYMKTYQGILSCEDYKHEDVFVESPVPIGATVYIRIYTNKKDRSEFTVKEEKVTGLHLRDEVGYRGLPRHEYMIIRTPYGKSIYYPFKDLGKKVFLSKEEAYARI